MKCLRKCLCEKILALGAVFALGLPCSVSAEDAPGTLEELMRGMAETPGVVAHFTETKELAMLDVPIVSEGTLYFIPPGRLARLTTSPGRSRMVIDGDRLSFEDETGANELSIGSHPVAREIVGNFIVLFNGDLGELRDRYRTRFETTDAGATEGASEAGAEGAATAGWSLELTPRSSPLDDFVASITLVGNGQALTEMVLVEAEGDRTRTVFRDVEVAHAFTEGEIRELFGAAALAKP